tara:strand:+ start:105 stop:572 length:468 start_codon:yes stop_codon:yes gene_type:complete
MEKLLRSTHALRLFFLVTASVGWASANYEKRLLRSTTPVAMAMFDAILTVVALLGFVVVRKGWQGLTKAGSEVLALARNETSALGLLSMFGAAGGLLGASLLKHHGVADYQLSALLISLAVGAIGTYAVGDGTVSWSRGAGLVLVAIGGYLTLRG